MDFELTKATAASGINEESKTIQIYPNPANGFVTISLHGFSVGQISIYDLAGNLMFQSSTINKSFQLYRGSEFNSGI